MRTIPPRLARILQSLRRRFARDQRAAVALMVGVMTPALIGAGAVVVDGGFWLVGQSRLQVAADAGAMSAGLLLQNKTVQLLSAADLTRIFETSATSEAQRAAPRLAGALQEVSVDWDRQGYSWVRVTLKSQMTSYMAAVLNVRAPLTQASAKAEVKKGKPSVPCLLTVGQLGKGIEVDNQGRIIADKCPVASNSLGLPSIYVNSGSIVASAISAVGTITKSNSGSNVLDPASLSANAAASVDPFAARSLPVPGACNVTNGRYTAYRPTPYNFAPATAGAYVFCGNTVIGGNGTTARFAPGTYYVVNGDLTFSNAIVTQATDVAFVLTGTQPGSFSWTNYSNTVTTIKAPTVGDLAGIAVFQACGKLNAQSGSFQGNSTLQISGALYLPCGKVDVGNNAVLKAGTDEAFSIVANSVYAHGSGTIRTAAGVDGSGGAGTTAVVLTE